MASINIEIETNDRTLVYDIFETNSLSTDQKKSVPGGAVIINKGMLLEKAYFAPEAIELIVSLGVGFISSMFANWLWNKLKGRVVTV